MERYERSERDGRYERPERQGSPQYVRAERPGRSRRDGAERGEGAVRVPRRVVRNWERLVGVAVQTSSVVPWRAVRNWERLVGVAMRADLEAMSDWSSDEEDDDDGFDRMAAERRPTMLYDRFKSYVVPQSLAPQTDIDIIMEDAEDIQDDIEAACISADEPSGKKWEKFSGYKEQTSRSSRPPTSGNATESSRSSWQPTSGNSTEYSSSSRACESSNTDDGSSYEDSVKNFSWDQVQDMTNGLTSTQLGKGGFGIVYLGKLSNGKKVAVKVLGETSQQGIPEFINEVSLLRRVNHGNLVTLLGYCQDRKKVLIYEFAEEGTLYDHLHGNRSRLDWKQRLSIALQSACGLEYLHTGCNPTIFHRDIKSENILITRRMIAKVADFGISKVGSDQDNIRRTHVTTMIKGTLGYLDPEYLRTGQLTAKSDVYSFGVLLLEIVTGRKPIQNSEKITSIIDWVNKQKGKAIADPFIEGNFNPKALKHVLSIAKQCTQPSGVDRPEMKKVVRVLEATQALEDEKKSSWSWF